MEKTELINGIKSGLLASELAVKLHIHDLDLYREINKLENQGYTLNKKIYSDGTFKYVFAGSDQPDTDEINIITKPDEQVIKILCMSDLHYTSKFQNLDMVHQAYDYAGKNDIKIIFNGGDILHGKFGHDEWKFLDGMEQIETFLNDYPFRNDTVTISDGGDHEKSIQVEEYLDPIKVISSRRHDIIIPDYSLAKIRIKDARIQLRHKRSQMDSNQKAITIPDCEVGLNGHYHRYDFYDNGGNVTINLPTTSNITSTINGFVVLTLTFNQDHLSKVDSEYISTINGKEIVLVHNAGVLSFKKGEVNNVENYNHGKIMNPYKPTGFKDDEEALTSLSEQVTNTTKELNETREVNKKYKEENGRLSSLLEDTQEEKEKLEAKVKSIKEEKNKQSEKIIMLNQEGRRLIESNRKLSSNNKELKESNENYKAKNEELLKELNEAKALLEQYKNNAQVVVAPVQEETEELDPIEVHELYEQIMAVEETKEDSFYRNFRLAQIKEYSDYLKTHKDEKEDKTFYYQEFKKKRIEEFSKYIKKQQEKEERERLRQELLEKARNFNEVLTYEDVEKSEELVDRMCDVMDGAALALSGEVEKKRILKANKIIAKGKRVMNSQMSKQDRIQELMSKAKNK